MCGCVGARLTVLSTIYDPAIIFQAAMRRRGAAFLRDVREGGGDAFC